MTKRYVDDYIRGEEWRSQAECRVDLPPGPISDEEMETNENVLRARKVMNLLFGVNQEEQELAVQKFCGACAVKDECLEDALKHRESDGVRGGMTEWERASFVARRKAG